MRRKQPGSLLGKIFLITVFTPIVVTMLVIGPQLNLQGQLPALTVFPQASPALPQASPTLSDPLPTIALTPDLLLVPTPSLNPDDIMKLTLTPRVSSVTLRIYRKGQALGNYPNAFSKVGDCNSLDPYFLSYFDLGPSAYNLGSYTYLQPAIDQFSGSFKRESLAAADGFNTSALLSPSRADANYCVANESPLECEYRLQKPSFAIISIGTDDYLTPARFEANMRQIINTTIDHGIVPILLTQMDDANQLHNNTIITQLAGEYDIPFANLSQAMQPLPQHGLEDNIHPTGETDAFVFSDHNLALYGWPVRNLTALQALYRTWRGVTQQ